MNRPRYSGLNPTGITMIIMIEDHMKDWLKDCYNEEYHEDIDALSDEKLLKVIEREYAGGVDQFVLDTMLA